jgi:hypothetical protein
MKDTKSTKTDEEFNHKGPSAAQPQPKKRRALLPIEWVKIEKEAV